MHSAHIAIGADGERRVQSCTAHSRAVGELARAALEECGLGEAGYLAGLLHDCGKFTDEFDAYLERVVRGEKLRRGSVIHSFAGVRWMLERFHTSDGSQMMRDIAAEVVAASIGSHHGLIDLWDERHQDGFGHRLKRQPDYDGRAMEAFEAECASREEVQALFERAYLEIDSFFQQRISKSVKTEEEAYFALGLLVRLLTSAVIDADRMDTRCFMQGSAASAKAAPDWEACAAQLSRHVAGLARLTPIQRARGVFSDCCARAAERESGLYRLDLPTGGGKTLAGLRFAVLHARKNGMRRIIYAAPLLSIIEQNASEIRAAVGDTVEVLEHHSNLLRENSDTEETSRTELLQETWDAQLIITTLVQLLNTMFDGKTSSVRRFQSLCRSVIIIDEVQSLPRKMLSMFNIAVNFLTQCCGATVLLCSATQPAFEAAKHEMLPCQTLIGGELLAEYAPLFRRTILRDAGHGSVEELAGRAAERVDGSGSLLIVCNTKREAAELIQALEKRTAARLFHLSAGMCMAHRRQTIEEIRLGLAQKEKLVCVSTQLIEAGVDISFGAAIRLAAGLDSIVQTAGRCNRHGEHAQPQPVDIYQLNNERLGSLREIEDAQRATKALLTEYGKNEARYGSDLSSDAAIQDYYGYLYKDMPLGAQDYPTHGQRLFELLSTNMQFAGEADAVYYLKQAFRTAGEWFEVFDSANESVLVPYGRGKALIERLNSRRASYDFGYAEGLLQEAKDFAVALPLNQLSRMAEQGMVFTLLDGSLYVLNAGYYDTQLGIREGNDLCSTQIW